MIDLSREGEVFVLRMDAGENRFTSEMVPALNRALDEVERTEGPKALVTVGSGKFYSNGLDLDEMMRGGTPEHAERYLRDVLAVLGRVLVFPAVTVAAVNGHAFGAGAQMAVAHDYRLMRSDRGFYCLPEIDMRVSLHPGMVAILAARIPPRTVHEVLVTGKRYGGEEAAARRIVDEAMSEERLLPRAIEIAAPLAAKAHPVMTSIKRGLYGPVLAALEKPLPSRDGA
jgi:enoyl-CoA hydratase/carnithine racemase